jgi:hypothetical protein
MKLRSAIAAAIAAAIIAAPAAAVTFDAFTSFTGVQGAGNFTYGNGNPTGSYTLYTVSNSSCFITGSLCLQLNAGNVPGVTKSASTSFQYGSVNVPNDRLLLHPGFSSGESVYVVFTAPFTGTYSANASFNVQDNSPTGVGVSFFINAGTPFVQSLGTLSSSNLSFNFADGGPLNAGEQVGFIFDNAGLVNNDSVGLNFSITGTVPEPAAWAMLIAGFGLIGAAQRRRRAAAIAA